MRQRWEIDELIESWSLDSDDLDEIGNKTGSTRLGFAVLLKFFELEARFPTSMDEVPGEAVDFVARQLDLRFDAWQRYEWSGRSWKRHRRQIRAHFGFRVWADTDIEPLLRALLEAVADVDARRDRLTDVAVEWCRNVGVELPSAAQLARFVSSAAHLWERNAALGVQDRLGAMVVARLESLLAADCRELLVSLRSGPGAVGVETVFAELEKLAVLSEIGVPSDVFAGFSSQIVQRWHDRFAITRPSALLVMSPADRLVLTSAWVHRRRETVIDGVVDLLIAIVHKIGAKAERRVEREQLADLRRVNGKTNMLYRLAQAVLDNPEGIVSDVLFPVVNEDTLRDLVKEHKLSGPAVRGQTQLYLRASYSRHYRRIVPQLLAALTFRSSPQPTPKPDPHRRRCRHPNLGQSRHHLKPASGP